jgi:hypothetical protein
MAPIIARVPADPVAELLELPKGYGRPRAPLAWAAVRARLVVAMRYWLATVRPDGRPHGCEELFPDGELAEHLARLSNDKYGWGPSPAEYARTGAWCLRPERVLGWERFPLDATRFLFHD